MHPTVKEFLDLYSRDVAEHPDAYKESVRRNPRSAAWNLIADLTLVELRQMLRDLKAERAMVKKLTRNPKKKTARKVKRNPVRVGKTKIAGPKKRPRSRSNVKPKTSRNRKGRVVKFVKRNPTKKAFTILGFDNAGNRWYFTGESFHKSSKFIMTYPSMASAELKMRDIVNQLPHQIEQITVATA